MPEQPSGAALPFAGVRVLDLAAPVSAYCGRLLAGYGADVVRLERPAAAVEAAGDDPRAAWLDAWYAAGCRRVTLDVADDRAAPLLAELAAGVDVVIASPTAATPVTGFVAEPLGLEWCGPSTVIVPAHPVRRHRAAARLAGDAPDGTRDERADVRHRARGRAAADDAGAAAVGRGRHPGRHLHRRRAARAPRVGGQVLDVAAHEVLASQDDIIHRFSVAGLVVQRRANFGVPPSGTWPVADGMVDIAVNTTGHWDAFVKTVGSPPELTDEVWQDRTVRSSCTTCSRRPSPGCSSSATGTS